MLVPIGQIPVGEGLASDGTPGAMFYIAKSALDTVGDGESPWKYDESRFVREAVADPDAIFEGLERHGHDSCLCYSVRPMHDPECPDSGTPPRYGWAFVAFARRCQGGWLIYDWAWRKEDPDCPGHPEGWEADFTRPTWRKI